MALLLGLAAAEAQVLEEIVVTAQKREVGLQSAPVAISALTGEALEKSRIFTVDDLAASVSSLGLTGGNSPVDLELNIRGITNTRLDSPSGEAAVGTFVDEIYIGRNGGMNTDFYDIERIEVIRGPQGVLLGKSVVGGALNIVTARPEFENSGSFTVGGGNFDSRLISGYLTGGFSEAWAGRLSFQSRQHDGYAKDVLHGRRLDDLESIQFRAQLLYQPAAGGWSARLVVDHNNDESNGINVVAVSDGQTGGFRPRPWSQMRAFLGLTDPYESVPEETIYAGNPSPVQQYLDRESTGVMLSVEKEFDGFAFTSVTGYRDARADNHYDQTGGGPDIFDYPEVFGVTFGDFLAFNPLAATFFFSEPVNEEADISAFSQELRLASTGESRLDWLLGLYFKRDEIDKVDRFVGENITGVLPTLSGESHWYNYGDITNFAAFGQVGWQLADTFKVIVGLRWTSDKKEGDIRGVQVATGDRFNPADPVPLTPLQGPYETDYGATWKKATPQATLEYTPNDDLFLYATVSTGFKGGYFQDTPNSAFAAILPDTARGGDQLRTRPEKRVRRRARAPERRRLLHGLHRPAGRTDQPGLPVQPDGKRSGRRNPGRRGGVDGRRQRPAADQPVRNAARHRVRRLCRGQRLRQLRQFTAANARGAVRHQRRLHHEPRRMGRRTEPVPRLLLAGQAALAAGQPQLRGFLRPAERPDHAGPGRRALVGIGLGQEHRRRAVPDQYHPLLRGRSEPLRAAGHLWRRTPLRLRLGQWDSPPTTP